MLQKPQSMLHWIQICQSFFCAKRELDLVRPAQLSSLFISGLVLLEAGCDFLGVVSSHIEPEQGSDTFLF